MSAPDDRGAADGLREELARSREAEAEAVAGRHTAEAGEREALERQNAAEVARTRAEEGRRMAEDARHLAERAQSGAETQAAEMVLLAERLQEQAAQLQEQVVELEVLEEELRQANADLEEARDAAERDQAYLAQVVDQMPVAVGIARAPDGQPVLGNRRIETLLRQPFRPTSEVVEERPAGFHADGRPYEPHEWPLARTLATGEVVEDEEIELVLADGTRVVAAFASGPIHDAEGRMVAAVVAAQDVTERRRSDAERRAAYEEARRARAAAEAANQAKSQFLAAMSHEIRTPINAIIGYTELLAMELEGPLTAGQRERLERIRSSSGHLLGLVNDVLDLSKIEAGEMIVEMEEVPAAGAISAALELVAPQADARGLRVVTETECPREKARYRGDPDRVRQVLVNLLSNAVKFTERGGTITTRCRVAERPEPGADLPDAGPWLVLEVEDTGRGIAPEDLSRIFQPFVQSETEHASRPAGTGLGLTISRRFARMMGGDLTVRSRLGEGSCFALWLPTVEQPAALPDTVSWARAGDWPGSAREVPGLAEVGRLLSDSAERLEHDLVGRIRADAEMPSAHGLELAQAGNHTAAFLSAVGKRLERLDQQGSDPGLLQDGAAIMEVIAVRHGRQRRRLGFAQGEVRREYRILHALLDSFVRAEAPRRTAADLAGALGIVHRLLDQAEESSLAAFDPRDAGGG